MIRRWGAELGFQQVGIADCELGEAETMLPLSEVYKELGKCRARTRVALVDACHARPQVGPRAKVEAAPRPQDLDVPRGVVALLGWLDRWAVCSNKHSRSGQAELARLGWRPEVALFSEAFGGPKRLAPVTNVRGGIVPSSVRKLRLVRKMRDA